MQWKLLETEATAQDPYGLSAFLLRLQAELKGVDGAPLAGFTFLKDARTMLQFTRQIENDLLDTHSRGPLFVGFQNAPKLDGEAARYRHLRSGGVVVYGFGEGQQSSDATDGLEAWYALQPNHRDLANQWFLVSLEPAPITFVGWEVSDESVWGKGKLSAPGKMFVGFVSDDRRVAEAVCAHLDTVRAQVTPVRADPRGLRRLLNEASARRVLLMVDDGRRKFLQRGLQRLSETNFGGAYEFFLYDLSAESYLVNPYPDDEPKRRQPLDARQLRQSFGRAYLAGLIEQLAARQVTARAILPYGVGFAHLAEWCAHEQIDTIIIPSEYLRPSLVERLRGYRFELLQENFRGTIIVEDDGEGARVLSASDEAVPALA